MGLSSDGNDDVEAVTADDGGESRTWHCRCRRKQQEKRRECLSLVLKEGGEDMAELSSSISSSIFESVFAE